MGSADRSKRRDFLWKKAILHFSLCFAMGFFVGFAPATSHGLFSSRVEAHQPSDRAEDDSGEPRYNRSLIPLIVSESSEVNTAAPSTVVATGQPKLLIIVTMTRSDDPLRRAMLRRLSQTLRLVPPPVLWIVVEAQSVAVGTAEMLRMTGIMYRQLVVKEELADPEAEMEHQRSVALDHIEHHRLDGIVHFADLSNVYDLQFFEEIRDIEAFGTWPVASVSANRKRVTIEGPICQSSQVLGISSNGNNESHERRTPRIGISSFAFNSSVLWDPERWGRSSSTPDSSQESMKFVQEVAVEEETKVLAFPPDCSRVLLWRLHIPKSVMVSSTVSSYPDTDESFN